MCYLAVFFVLGILLQMAGQGPFFAAAVFLSALAVMEAADKKNRQKLLVLLLLLSGMAGYFRCSYEARITERCEALLEDGDVVRLQGKIYKKENGSKENLLYLDHAILQSEGQILPSHSVIVRISDKEYPIGTTIVAEGTVRMPVTAANDGGYDEKKYYHSLNMDYQIRAEKITGEYGKPDRLREALYQFKERLKENYQKLFSEENAGIISTMVLGDRELLRSDTKNVYRQAGISHALTISGMHISFVGMMVYRLLRKKGSLLLSGSISCIFLWGYVEMVGMGISALRALFMFVLLMGGTILGRSYDSLTALAASALLLLWQNPCLVLHAGFQFSVAAVLGATWLERSLQETLERSNSGTWRKRMHAAVLGSVSIQLATMPLVVYYYYELPVYAVLLNLVVVQVLSLILVLGTLCAVIGICSISVACLAAKPLGMLLSCVTALANLSLQLPLAQYPVGHSSVSRIVLYYLFLMAFVFTVKKFYKKPEVCPCRRMSLRRNARLCRRALLLAELTGMLLLLLLPQKNDMLCAFLDVGQGDGIYLQPAKGVHVFVDGGSSDQSGLGEYRILPFFRYHRILWIDEWFVSHYDTDHVSALIELLEQGYEIRNLILPCEKPDNANYQQIVRLASEHGIPISYFDAGDSLRIGDTTITALLPDQGRSAQVTEGDENANGMVLYVAHPAANILLTGDSGAEDEAWMLEAESDHAWKLFEIDILKACHHGSKYSNTEEFLQRLRPQVTVISCSETNRYGHPAAEAVEHMEAVGSMVYYTMKSGQITVRAAGEKAIRMDCCRP
ncbi:MAG: DNA internalization-related competence protein ComEC/Rec2 [Lachnospiraceae bacterium]|nr:DNA internalization-related competence protein ComEC/Rec2 [Lachnospiraceae bacterium]